MKFTGMQNLTGRVRKRNRCGASIIAPAATDVVTANGRKSYEQAHGSYRCTAHDGRHPGKLLFAARPTPVVWSRMIGSLLGEAPAETLNFFSQSRFIQVRRVLSSKLRGGVLRFIES